MSFGIEQAPKNKSWTKLLLEESEFSLRTKQMKRERTFRRMYMTVFVLFGSTFLVICSLFYVGAFFDVGKIVGVSQADRAERAKAQVSVSPNQKDRGFFAPLTDLMNVNRVYMRSGQTILATYSVPKGSEMTLIIHQCKSKPVLEVFDCELVGEQKKLIRNKTKGFIRFTVGNPGFYHFGEKVKIRGKDELKANAEYRVIWQRG